MIRRKRGLALLVVAVISLALVPASSAALATTCLLGGPAGTATVLRFEVPAGGADIAVRVTTPTGVAARPSDVLGGRSSWHMATGLAVVGVSDVRLAASRFVQSGSSSRRVAVSAAGRDERADVIAPGAPFNHTGGEVPDSLPGGTYYAVAFGTDGGPELPNPWWSAELTVGAAIDCTPLEADTRIFDNDATDFRGGEQVTAFGAGHATGARLALRLGAEVAVGMIDAQRQMVGSVRVRYHGPGGFGGSVEDGLKGFSGGAGRYSFTTDHTGTFPLVLVAGVSFRLK